MTFLSFMQGGIPLHQHNHKGVKKVYDIDPDDILVNLLLTGEKRWALYPQNTDIENLYPMDHDATRWGGTLRFFFQPFFAQLNRFPKANRIPMIEAVQKPGELLLFPQYALHGTWSPSATLGVLLERGEA